MSLESKAYMMLPAEAFASWLVHLCLCNGKSLVAQKSVLISSWPNSKIFVHLTLFSPSLSFTFSTSS